MIRRAASAFLAALLLVGTAPQARALSCSETPTFGETVDQILREQRNDRPMPRRAVIALGTLSEPETLRCRDKDWTNQLTCTGRLRLTGRLISPEGVTELSGQPVTGTFYKHATEARQDPPFPLWRPWTDAPIVMALMMTPAGELEFSHLDSCGSFNMAPLTDAIDRGLMACAARGRCTAGERRRLDAARDRALTPR